MNNASKVDGKNASTHSRLGKRRSRIGRDQCVKVENAFKYSAELENANWKVQCALGGQCISELKIKKCIPNCLNAWNRAINHIEKFPLFCCNECVHVPMLHRFSIDARSTMKMKVITIMNHIVMTTSFKATARKIRAHHTNGSECAPFIRSVHKTKQKRHCLCHSIGQQWAADPAPAMSK